MARSIINLGVAPTGQGGDTFRTASQKNNDNSAELYAGPGGRALVANAKDPVPGRVPTVGYGGIGALDNAVFEGTFLGPEYFRTGGTVTGQFNILGSAFTGSLTTYAGSAASVCTQVFFDWSNGQQYNRVMSNSSWLPWQKVYTTGNTTRAADGTLKAI
jgi:hypothetical protein